MLMKGPAILNCKLRTIDVPLTLQAKILTFGGVSDDVVGCELEKSSEF